MDLQKLLESLAEQTTTTTKKKKEHRFWNTQPVQVSVDTEDTDDGPIDSTSSVRPTPYPLPPPYHFCSLDLSSPAVLDEVYALLRDNYVEDVDEEFRFEYSREFLRWALMPPGYSQDWHIGVRVGASVAGVAGASAESKDSTESKEDGSEDSAKAESKDSTETATASCTTETSAETATASCTAETTKSITTDTTKSITTDTISSITTVATSSTSTNTTQTNPQQSSQGKLVAFIAAIPCGFRVRSTVFPHAVEVNFLCVSKALRSKRLTPMLIREVTRRVNLQGIFQALYTAGVELPGPCHCAPYYHRPLRVQELIKTGFCPPEVIDRPLEPSPLSLRQMRKEDLPSIRALLAEYLERFQLAALFAEDREAEHWLMPAEGVNYALVSEDLSAFVSFYSIPTAVLGTGELLQVAYLSYYAVRDEAQLLPLLRAVLREAQRAGFHVFNALKVMGNTEAVLEGLGFGRGDGQLRYYLYNWKTKPFEGHEVGFIML